jgi:GNAT superfamily N-acetyltransferase
LSKQKIAIRPATVADVKDITECVRKAYEHYVPIIGIPPLPLLDDYRVVIQQKQVSVLVEAASVIGVLVLEITDEGFLLNNVAVDPRHQGKRYGSLLLQFAEDEAKRQGHNAIYLYTNVKMTQNQAIYAARGYIEYDRREANGRHGVYMRKRFADAG